MPGQIGLCQTQLLAAGPQPHAGARSKSLTFAFGERVSLEAGSAAALSPALPSASGALRDRHAHALIEQPRTKFQGGIIGLSKLTLPRSDSAAIQDDEFVT